MFRETCLCRISNVQFLPVFLRDALQFALHVVEYSYFRQGETPIIDNKYFSTQFEFARGGGGGTPSRHLGSIFRARAYNRN